MAKQIMSERLCAMKDAIVKDDLLFHSVHGLCRVSDITRPTRSEETSYALLPVSANRAKVRFVIPQSSMENSGFRKLMSRKEAQAIVDYFKSGKKKESEDGHSWMLAATISTEAASKDFLKDARRRQAVERAVKGLCAELAFVLDLTVRDIADRIQKNLGPVASIHPLVLAALANVDKD